jgi:hypothetical protein
VYEEEPGVASVIYGTNKCADLALLLVSMRHAPFCFFPFVLTSAIADGHADAY